MGQNLARARFESAGVHGVKEYCLRRTSPAVKTFREYAAKLVDPDLDFWSLVSIEHTQCNALA